LTAAIAVCAGVTLAAVSNVRAEDQSRLDVVLQRGKLIVVTLTTVPPYAFKDDKGDLVGIDIDIAHLIANALFKDPEKIEFISVTSDGRWPAIESGRADLGVGGTTTYMDRALHVAFTDAITDSSMSIMVSKAAAIKSLADLNQEKFTIAILNNPQMADRAKIYFPNTKVLTFDTPSGEFLAVKSGRAQALQIDTPTADFFASTNKDQFDVLPQLLGAVTNNAIYLRTGDFRWWQWLETFVKELKTGSLYPQYVQIYQKWFGKNPPPQRFYIPAVQ
jgi:polar amino acid transport system substrate-binding protein